MSEEQSQKLSFQTWLSALRSEVGLERCEAAESPPEGAAPHEVVAALIPLLDDANELVRMSAAETLGLYPAPETRDALRDYVGREPSALARAHGLSSLGMIGERGDLTILLEALESPPEPAIAVHALVGAYELMRRLAKQRLATLLAHEGPETRTLAAEALVSLVTPRDDEDTLRALREALERETVPGTRDDIRAAIASVWSEPARAEE
ncbi:HEAT repeat domain-containing protein [Haliangium sp.]|uniref:HEAT repeat domain-containing protein n=1 Tax=Haliangium sp. TaxID=2663208 RepID=UPI003D0D7261